MHLHVQRRKGSACYLPTSMHAVRVPVKSSPEDVARLHDRDLGQSCARPAVQRQDVGDVNAEPDTLFTGAAHQRGWRQR